MVMAHLMAGWMELGFVTNITFDDSSWYDRHDKVILAPSFFVMLLLSYYKTHTMNYLGLVTTHYVHNILIGHRVAETDSLRNVTCTGTPNECILEGLLERTVDAIAHVLDSAIAADDQRLTKVGVDSLALGVDAD